MLQWRQGSGTDLTGNHCLQRTLERLVMSISQSPTLWMSSIQPTGAEMSAVPQRVIQVPGPWLSGDCSFTGASSSCSLSYAHTQSACWSKVCAASTSADSMVPGDSQYLISAEQGAVHITEQDGRRCARLVHDHRAGELRLWQWATACCIRRTRWTPDFGNGGAAELSIWRAHAVLQQAHLPLLAWPRLRLLLKCRVRGQHCQSWHHHCCLPRQCHPLPGAP
jgi:hypothetical protein